MLTNLMEEIMGEKERADARQRSDDASSGERAAPTERLVRLKAKRHSGAMPRFRATVPVDDYVLDVLMRDLVGHDAQPAAFVVFLFLHGRAARNGGRPVAASLRMIADETGLSKSAAQTAV